MRSSADRAEMRHHKLSNKGIHTHTQIHRKFVFPHMLNGIPPPCHPLTMVFALYITSTIALHPLTSSLPVSSPNQSVGCRGGRGGGGRREHSKEPPMGVSTTPDCGCCTLSLLTASQECVRDFSSYFVYLQGNIMSLVYMID